VVRAIWIEPDPHESEPVVESGVADAGADTFGEGAASVTVRCGSGGGWTAAGSGVVGRGVGEGVISGAATGRGLIFFCA
jgi:hypothetical protein